MRTSHAIVDDQESCSFALLATAEIFVRVKISYSSLREFSYAIKFCTARAVSQTLVSLHDFRMLINFVLSAESTKYTKLNRV